MQVYCSKQHANFNGDRFCTHCGESLPLPIGEVVDNRYQIVRLLGQGGFGRTYLAVDTQKKSQQCVLKEFAPQSEKPEELQKAKELFEREASILKKLQHPQIPQFHSSLQVRLGSRDFFFLVQDYIDGEDYFQLLARRQSQGQTFSEEEILSLLHKLLPVLSYIHSLDVVHRDISPDNLILRRTDNLPMLIDFGGVKQLPAAQGFWFTQLNVNGTLLGKKGYAPDEQLIQGKVLRSSDLYSLAVTVLVLLTAKEPSALYNSFNSIWRWGQEIKVSPKLESVLKKMLAHRPSDRYQKAEQVLKDLPPPNSPQPLNPYISKIKTMVLAPGIKQVQVAIASKVQSNTQLVVQVLPMPIWLRPFGASLLISTVALLAFAGSFTLIKGITIPSITLPKISLPIIQPVNDKHTTHDIQKILSRRQDLEIPSGFFTRLVDEVFYTKRTELKGRSLTLKPEDADLRDEWYGTAADLLNKIEQANLSRASLRKLGSYSSRDYETWRQEAQAGQLGKYKTIEQLKEDTYAKFNLLFPGQQRGKLNQQTFLQIWYAIASDLVSNR